MTKDQHPSNHPRDDRGHFRPTLIQGGKSEERKPYDVYADSTQRARKAIWNERSDIAIAQARAFLSYGDLDSAVATITEFVPAFEKRFGALT